MKKFLFLSLAILMGTLTYSNNTQKADNPIMIEQLLKEIEDLSLEESQALFKEGYEYIILMLDWFNVDTSQATDYT